MTADRPYVDRRVVDLDAAHVAAQSATERWNLAEPSLLRRGMNAIYTSGDVVIRVGLATAEAAASHDLARVLAAHDIPVVPPIEGRTAEYGEYAVTAWRRIEPTAEPIDWSAVGHAVATIHRIDPTDLPPAYPLPAPTAFPWWDFDGLIASVADHIDEIAITGLSAMIERHRSWAEASAVGAVVCHGDVHPGNVLMTEDGPVLIDFDLLCLAAPAWDHAMLTTYADRWGGERDVYPAFANGYGCSLEGDRLTTSLASLRNVAATLMRVRAGITDPAARVEAERRLRYWRGDPDAPDWSAQ